MNTNKTGKYQNRFLLLREEAKIPISEIAQVMDVSEGTVKKWESGYKLTSLEKMVELCRLYKSTLSYALCLSDVKSQNDKYEINLRLSELRKSQRMSRPHVSKETGIHVNSFLLWEKNETNIRLEPALTLSEFFGVSIDYFLGLTVHITWEKYQTDSVRLDMPYTKVIPVWLTPSDVSIEDAQGFWALWDRKKNVLYIPGKDPIPYPSHYSVLPLDADKVKFVKNIGSI